jgi:26S proteasome subunit RPN7
VIFVARWSKFSVSARNMTTIPTVPSAVFDVDLYITQRYAGEARIQRLLWVALQEPSSPHRNNGPQPPPPPPLAHQVAAWVACLETIQQHGNIVRYKELYQHYHARFNLTPNHGSTDASSSSSSQHPPGILPPYDANWIHEAEARNRQEREMLMGRMHAAQAHLNKEAIRIAYTALSYFQVRMGEYHDALANAFKAKDYCTSRSQTASNSLQILVVSLYLRNFQTVAEFAPRLENTVSALSSNTTATATSSAETSTTMAAASSATAAAASNSASASAATSALGVLIRNKVWMASGLERLSAGDYRSAAAKFRSVAMQPPSQTDSSSSESSPQLMDGSTAASTTISGSISAMFQGSFKDSALDDWDCTVLAPDDVALYAAILTMATETHRSTAALTLTQLHPESLERVPILMEILSCFYHRAEYRRAWELLETHVWPLLENDIYFGHVVSDMDVVKRVGNMRTGKAVTHLTVVQEAIRQKAMGLYWTAYHNCPLSSMAAALGPGIAGPDGAPYLRDTILSLLANRRRPTTDPADRYLFPMDTRFDATTNTLVRTVPTASDEQDACLRATHRHFDETSTRVLNDTYSLVVRLACMETNLIVTGDKTFRSMASNLQRTHGRSSQVADHNVVAQVEANPPPDYYYDEDEIGDDDDDLYLDDDRVMGDANINEMNPEDMY